jgi:crotonobetainyl-CoA:carnitine CoA-transferase CaiB-like acyl-CoA transferase
MFGVMGVLASLYERERSGRGQHVDIAMVDCQISMLNYMATMHFLSGQDPYPIGNAHFVHVPYDTFRCSDGFIVIAVITDNFWQNLKKVVACPEFDDPSFDGQPGRWAGREFINRQLNDILGQHTCAHWLAQLEAQRIPCAPVNSFSQALSDPQVLHRNMVIDLQHPDGSSTRGPGNPIKLSRTSEESFSPAPLLGSDTDDVMALLLGMTAQDIEALKTQGVIA